MPAHPLTLRPALAADLELLLAMMEEFYREEAILFERETARGAIEELSQTPALGSILLLVVDEEVIGYLVAIQSFILEFGGRQTFLDELFIAEKWRGKGLGKCALAAVEKFARENHSRALRLEAARTNARALAMYERVGFERHDRFTMTKVLR